jgi:hypothetical protein
MPGRCRLAYLASLGVVADESQIEATSSLERVFYISLMRRPGRESDDNLEARLAGTAASHAAAGDSATFHAGAGEADESLSPRLAAANLSAGESKLDAARYRLMVALLIKAGADESLIARWVAVG